ncbi:hypothetical protein GCM10018953_75200 [Streptosporangium nondiastaticum]|uniref:transposase n=1 Tax=Streptosporangium nondiastaticum TaxID=35764 RepID=UPI00338AB1C7
MTRQNSRRLTVAHLAEGFLESPPAVRPRQLPPGWRCRNRGGRQGCAPPRRHPPFGRARAGPGRSPGQPAPRGRHSDAAIITGFPGLADLTGARVLAEIGDDRARFAVVRALKAYAGSAPITRASGKSLVVHHRKVKTSARAAELLAWTNPPGPGISGHRAEFGVDGARLTCHQFSPVRPATPFGHPGLSHAAEKYDAQFLT